MYVDPTAIDIILPPNIIEYLDDTSMFKRGKVWGDKDEKPIRSSDTCFRDQRDWVGRFCMAHVQSINDDVYKYQLNDEFHNKTYQYSHYNVNDHYGWHIDYIRTGDKDRPLHRKLSFSLLLNDDYEGGELEFVLPQYGMELKWNRIALESKAGSLIVFPSILGHRVTPVTKGTRKSIVGWCMGRQFT